MKHIDLEHWWRALAAAGSAIVVASVAVSFVPTILIGLGILFIGIGEWMQHPQQQFLVGESALDRGLLTTNPRIPKPLGFALDLLGAGIILAGVIKLLLA